jgi:hypothetical protein
MDIYGLQRRKRLIKLPLSIIEYNNNNPNESLYIIKKTIFFVIDYLNLILGKVLILDLTTICKVTAA